MTLEITIVGPGLEVLRKLEAGDAALVLGRDASCDICLPDPRRKVSRKHLALWNLEEVLQFRVLSVVNGIALATGNVSPGSQGELPAGQAIMLGDYRIEVRSEQPVRSPSATDADPWAVFDGQGPGGDVKAALPDGRLEGGTNAASPARGDEDPFGDWGFESTFGNGLGAALALRPSGTGATDLSAFFRGVGLDPAQLGPLGHGELEAIGKAVRIAVAGLLELHASRHGVTQDLRAEDRTMVAVKDNNPLKTDWPVDTKLQYLFGGRAASVGFIGPERALRSLLGELVAHDKAVGSAARAAVEGTVRDFSPASLEAQFPDFGGKLFASARAWDAYGKYYADHGQDMAAWVQQFLGKYFTETYLRESSRIKREMGEGRE